MYIYIYISRAVSPRERIRRWVVKAHTYTSVCKEVTASARGNVPSIRFFIHLYARPGQRPFTSRRGGGGNINFKIFCRPFPRSTLLGSLLPCLSRAPFPPSLPPMPSHPPLGQSQYRQKRKRGRARGRSAGALICKVVNKTARCRYF